MDMANKKEELLKGWIQYMKNNRIVRMQSDPQTGNLNYTRSPTIDDLNKFLAGKTNYKTPTINKAISKTPNINGNDLSEKNIEDLFDVLTPMRSANSGSSPRLRNTRPGNRNKQSIQGPNSASDKKQEEMNKIIRVIRGTMSDVQRKSLWRALKDA